ncbi:hypothetical protein GCM10022267_03860 [Lentzea roselyniae]|uniref:Uncharacterized protein n=1 Tax=Lentzea roselyniae TaxID=531940 RepID=A0ABP6ZW23_9PSEU
MDEPNLPERRKKRRKGKDKPKCKHRRSLNVQKHVNRLTDTPHQSVRKQNKVQNAEYCRHSERPQNSRDRFPIFRSWPSQSRSHCLKYESRKDEERQYNELLKTGGKHRSSKNLPYSEWTTPNGQPCVV